MTDKSTNIWDYKPSWCQPWSIVATGIVITLGSWLLLHIWWLTLGVGMAIAIWWIYFLWIYPQAFAKYLQNQQNGISGDN